MQTIKICNNICTQDLISPCCRSMFTVAPICFIDGMWPYFLQWHKYMKTWNPIRRHQSGADIDFRTEGLQFFKTIIIYAPMIYKSGMQILSHWKRGEASGMKLWLYLLLVSYMKSRYVRIFVNYKVHWWISIILLVESVPIPIQDGKFDSSLLAQLRWRELLYRR